VTFTERDRKSSLNPKAAEQAAFFPAGTSISGWGPETVSAG